MIFLFSRQLLDKEILRCILSLLHPACSFIGCHCLFTHTHCALLSFYKMINWNYISAAEHNGWERLSTTTCYILSLSSVLLSVDDYSELTICITQKDDHPSHAVKIQHKYTLLLHQSSLVT